MVGRITLIVVLTLVVVYVALPTSAQDESSEPVRRSPLGERLQRFRNEIFGEVPRRGGPTPQPSRKMLRRAQPVQAAPVEVETPVEAMTPTQPTPTRRSYVTVPSYLETQGARPATLGGSRRMAPPPDSATRNLRSKMSSMRRGGQETGSQWSDADSSGFGVQQEELPSEPASEEFSDEPQPFEASSALPYEDDEQQDVRIEPVPADAYEPVPTISVDSQADADGVIYPAREAAQRDATGVARGARNRLAPSFEENEYPEEDSDEQADGPTPADPLDEADPSFDEPVLPLDEPTLALDEDTRSPDDTEQSTDEYEETLDEPARSPDDYARSLGDDAESLDDTSRSADEPAKSLHKVRAAADEPATTLDEVESADVLFTARSPVLSVKATGPRTVLIGTEAEFVVTLRNKGAAANNVVISVNVPSGADVARSHPTIGDARAARGTDQHDVLQWSIDRLEADSSETLTLKLVPRSNAPLDLAVNWTFTPETSQAVVEVQEPKLTMNLAGPNEVLYGQTKVYKLNISNPGNGDTHNVSVGLVPLGQTGEAATNHKLGTLKAGESKTIDIELTARQAGAVTIKAHAFADGGLRAEAAEQVLVRRASLQVEVEAPRVRYAGTVGVFQVKVENTGDATAENVQISAMLPPDSKFVSASNGGRHEPQRAQVNWSIGSLQAGGRRVFELQCGLSAPGENRMQFAAAADGDVNAAATSNTRVEAIADLKLEVRDPQGPVAVGDEASYEVRVQNRGTKSAEGVDLAIFFSEGLEATAADGGSHDIGAGQVIFRPIETLDAGDTAVFQVRARADSAGNHVFRAEVTCRSLGTKLATEEATHFYGERRATADTGGEPRPAAEGREPTLATPPEELPTPARAELDDSPYDEPLSE